MTRTVQLRRYRLVPGSVDDFVAWFQGPLLSARRAHGFRIEFAYPVPESDEFVWAVSLEGDEDAFRAVEERYTASPERAEAFRDVPQRVASSDVRIVRPLEV